MTLKLLTVIAACACAPLYAQGVQVRDAWAPPGQHATGVFMTLSAKGDVKLVAVATPVAGVAEVHQMKMVGDIMQMRTVPGGLHLPAGQAVVLKPGGSHVMLMDLKAPLLKGGSIALTLFFKDAKGVQSQLELKVPVAARPQASDAQDDAGHAGHKP